MPLYAYQCQTCDDTFEMRRSFAEASLATACPTCDGSQTKKLLSRINMGGQAEARKQTIPLSMKSGGGCCGPRGCGCHGH